MSQAIVEVTDQSFEKLVLKSDKPVLVDFWAPWCGPCRMVAPILDDLATEYEGKMTFAKLNTDENLDVSMQYQIQSIPTLLFFQGGRVVDKVIGVMPREALRRSIEQTIGARA